MRNSLTERDKQNQIQNDFLCTEDKDLKMELFREDRDVKRQSKIKRLNNNGRGIEVIPDNQLMIRLPDSRILRVIARSVFLALVIITFTSFDSILGGPSSSYCTISEPGTVSKSINGDFLLILFQDLFNEGLIKSGDKALFVSNGAHQISIGTEMNLIFESDVKHQNSVPNNTFDFAFASGFKSAQFIDRTLKIGGIAVVELSYDPLDAFYKPSNYEIVHLRHFESTFVAMRKTSPSYKSMNSPMNSRRRCEFRSEAMKTALKNLEDVLLEPPRTDSIKSNEFLKRIKFLPDLMGDSLEDYPRRVFIDVGSPDRNSGDAGWFKRIYPRRNQEFEMYEIEKVALPENLPEKETEEVGISEWLKMNVKEEEFVVMKVEVELVEEMVKSRVICLVDELFLECKHQGMGLNGKRGKSGRAYWECLALYGKVRNEGVAVHQWWS